MKHMNDLGRHMILLVGLCCLLNSVLSVPVSGLLTDEDLNRASGLRQRVGGNVLNADLNVQWTADGRRLWYRVQKPGGDLFFWEVDTVNAKRSPAFDHEALAKLLEAHFSQSGDPTTIDPQRLPVARITIDEQNDTQLLVVHERGVVRVVVGDGKPSIEEAQADDPFRVPLRAAGSDMRSWGGSGSTQLIFTNQNEHAVRVDWVDADGQFHTYATLKPGKSHRQPTIAGHVWRVVEDGGGQELLRLRAGRTFGVVLIPNEPVTEDLADRDRDHDWRRDMRWSPPDRVSPDDRWRIDVNNHNLVLFDQETEEPFALTEDASPENTFGHEVIWSPDSRHVLAVQTKKVQPRKVHLIQSTPPDQLQPKLVDIDYAKPGDPIDHSRPRLFDVIDRKEIEVDDTLFDEPWSINRFHFTKDGSTCYFIYNQRGHQVMRVVAIDTNAGATRAVVDERSDTFIDYSNKTYLHYFDETDEFLWMSERDGWNHLYLIDGKSGSVVRQVTSGPWLVKRVDDIDVTDGRRTAALTILGHPAHSGQDPYFEHHARVDIDTGELTLLTQSNGTHALNYSPDGKHYVDKWSRVDQPPVYELRRSDDGSLVCELSRADCSLLIDVVGRLPEPFVAKGRDGQTDIWGVIHRPTNFDPNKRYPVLEQIYAGPHGQHVPKSFSAYHGAQQFAELGFIVVQIDGMGTNWRSKAFHDVAWKNLKDAGFPDRIAWIKAAAEHEPAMDIGRVGIYGGSAGGQNAMRAVLDYADFYKAAMADCGCHDNRMDKIWWNEAWMGYPVDESYIKSSNLVDAHKLGGALLLTVGAMDNNVDPSSTYQVADALIKANKDFDLIVFPSGGHGSGGSDYGWRRTAKFFVEHLGVPESTSDTN